MSIETAIRIADVLGVSLDVLLREDPLGAGGEAGKDSEASAAAV
jgi:hypothetical protein